MSGFLEGATREPSYRYITVRENADVVRERIAQREQVQIPYNVSTFSK